MDNFMNLAKQGYQQYERMQGQQQGQQQGQSQGGNNFAGMLGGMMGGGNNGGQQQQQQQEQQYNVQGGPQYNAPHGFGGSQQVSAPHVDENEALSMAQNHAGQSDQGLQGLFSQGLAMAKQFGNQNSQSPQNVQVDEQGLQNAHAQAYQQGNAGNMDASQMGAAAAMNAFKKFMGGSQGQQQSSGGSMQSKLIGMAMAEASKLFDQSGGAASGNKQDAISSASTTIMQLMLKSQMSGATGTGGLGNLMGMAQKFL